MITAMIATREDQPKRVLHGSAGKQLHALSSISQMSSATLPQAPQHDHWAKEYIDNTKCK